jgi:cation:H+ antiporter
MSELLQTILLFAVALFFLIKSADYLVKYSEKLGLSLGVPSFIIGITIISAGTSLPELATSLFSIFKGEPAVVAGNVIGSNIANILLVVGVATVIARKIEIKRSLIRLDLPLLVGASSILVLTVLDGKFTFIEGVVSILGFVIYLIYSLTEQKKPLEEKEKGLIKTLKGEQRPPFKWTYILWIVISAIALYFSANFTIDAVIAMGAILNLDTSIIAITAIAVGTSLPELIVSVTAAKKGKFDIALGNVLGSNIFNGFIIMGVSGVITDLPIQPAVLNIGVPFLIIATIFLSFSGIERKFYNWEGALYLILYFLFIGQLFNFI